MGIASRYGRLAARASKMSATVRMRISRRVDPRSSAQIAGAIQLFVVRAGDFAQILETGNAAEDFKRVVGMLFDHFPLVIAQAPGFSKMLLETPSLPMSCTSAARRIKVMSSSLSPSCREIPVAASATPFECR